MWRPHHVVLVFPVTWANGRGSRSFSRRVQPLASGPVSEGSAGASSLGSFGGQEQRFARRSWFAFGSTFSVGLALTFFFREISPSSFGLGLLVFFSVFSDSSNFPSPQGFPPRPFSPASCLSPSCRWTLPALCQNSQQRIACRSLLFIRRAVSSLSAGSGSTTGGDTIGTGLSTGLLSAFGLTGESSRTLFVSLRIALNHPCLRFSLRDWLDSGRVPSSLPPQGNHLSRAELLQLPPPLQSPLLPPGGASIVFLRTGGFVTGKYRFNKAGLFI